jgi:voltage-gated potassium channel
MATPRPRVTRFEERVTLPRAIAAIIGVFAAFTVLAAFVEYLVDPKFGSFAEALWWAIQTVSTVGYGDDVPSGTAGRIVASIVMLFGMAFVPAVTSIVVAILLDRSRREREAEKAERQES